MNKRFDRPTPKDEFKFTGTPIQETFSKDGLEFSIREDANGTTHITFKNKQGKTIDLASLLPKGWRFYGHKLTYESPFHTGLYDSDSSTCEEKTKSITISEKQLREMGIKYAFIVLHEIGHMLYDRKHPEMRGKMKKLYKRPSSDMEAFIKIDRNYRKNERSAWAHALVLMRKLLKELDLDPYTIFENPEEVKSFIREDFLFKAEAIESSAEWQLKKTPKKERDAMIEGLIEEWIGR
jgi:hypothetical protein